MIHVLCKIHRLVYRWGSVVKLWIVWIGVSSYTGWDCYDTFSWFVFLSSKFWVFWILFVAFPSRSCPNLGYNTLCLQVYRSCRIHDILNVVDVCSLNKPLPVNEWALVSKSPFYLIHPAVWGWGPYPVLSNVLIIMWCFLIDDLTRYTRVFCMHRPSKKFSIYFAFIAMVKTYFEKSTLSILGLI